MNMIIITLIIAEISSKDSWVRGVRLGIVWKGYKVRLRVFWEGVGQMPRRGLYSAPSQTTPNLTCPGQRVRNHHLKIVSAVRFGH